MCSKIGLFILSVQENHFHRTVIVVLFVSRNTKMLVPYFLSLAASLLSTLSLVAAANLRLFASHYDEVSTLLARDVSSVASGPVSSLCPGIVPGTGSAPGVVC